MIEDGRVAVTVHWSPPANSDLPVSRYKVSYQQIIGKQFHEIVGYQ